MSLEELRHDPLVALKLIYQMRSAVGLAELPIGIAVEVEAVVQIRTGDH